MSTRSEWESLRSKMYKVGWGVMTYRTLQSLAKFICSIDLCSRLIRALLFTKSGMFVNPARVSPDVFVAEFGRLKLQELSSVAVCIMTGIVTDCAIVSDGYTGGPDNEKTVHKISLAPFRQEFRRDTTMWGKILNFDSLSCAISTEGLSFTTKPRTLSAPVFPSSCMSHLVSVSLRFFYVIYLAVASQKTPKKGGSRTMSVMLSPAPACRADNYIMTRSFEQRGHYSLSYFSFSY